jgi:long-subunit acyl-CoA synthetase (AMP-forming)
MSTHRFRFLSTTLTRRSLSNIIRSPYSCPELRTDLINLSVPQFTMAKFLNEDVQNKTAFVDGFTGESWTYQQMFTQTHKFSHCLLDLGISKGDCVGIMSPNHIHFFTSFQGLGLIGAISTPIVSVSPPPLHCIAFSSLPIPRILFTPKQKLNTNFNRPRRRWCWPILCVLTKSKMWQRSLKFA